MTLNLFITLLIGLCSISILFTEAIKAFLTNMKKEASANLIALIDSIVIGIGGTSIAYVFIGIPFTLENILVIVCMTMAIWIGSMTSYDKVIQLIEQLKK